MRDQPKETQPIVVVELIPQTAGACEGFTGLQGFLRFFELNFKAFERHPKQMFI